MGEWIGQQPVIYVAGVLSALIWTLILIPEMREAAWTLRRWKRRRALVRAHQKALGKLKRD
jgi:hypothetical protein